MEAQSSPEATRLAQWFSFLSHCIVEMLFENSKLHSDVNTDKYATVVTNCRGPPSAFTVTVLQDAADADNNVQAVCCLNTPT
jgi:hypothetical protein